MDDETNLVLQREEQDVLAAIFDANFTPHNSTIYFVLSLSSADNEGANSATTPRELHLAFHLPSTYPTHDPPIMEIENVYCGPLRVTDAIREEVAVNLPPFVAGEVILYEWIMWLKDHFEQKLSEFDSLQPPTVPDDQGRAIDLDGDIEEEKALAVGGERGISDSFNSDRVKCDIDIIHGEAIIDRKSVFVAHLAEVKSLEEVEAVKETLLRDKRIARATHNISAFRIIQSNNGVLQDQDDDGETAAGGRLLHLLQILDAKNVLVVVSRWYGGIPLGPNRFKHISNAARQILDECGYINQDKGKKKKVGKK
ncbi:uncharacterized protein VTP21DRAFT_3459 [Calcarisporiella thermophila]|uniref:uncharacterized protein n=1 Tax=Calcarisporiella thermophila TaxID=911321 RepID=UPI00374411F2